MVIKLNINKKMKVKFKINRNIINQINFYKNNNNKYAYKFNINP